jgi:hypothetical protein
MQPELRRKVRLPHASAIRALHWILNCPILAEVVQHHDELTHAFDQSVDRADRQEVIAPLQGAHDIIDGAQHRMVAHMPKATDTERMARRRKEGDVIHAFLKSAHQLRETVVPQDVVCRVVDLVELI